MLLFGFADGLGRSLFTSLILRRYTQYYIAINGQASEKCARKLIYRHCGNPIAP